MMPAQLLAIISVILMPTLTQAKPKQNTKVSSNGRTYKLSATYNCDEGFAPIATWDECLQAKQALKIGISTKFYFDDNNWVYGCIVINSGLYYNGNKKSTNDQGSTTGVTSHFSICKGTATPQATPAPAANKVADYELCGADSIWKANSGDDWCKANPSFGGWNYKYFGENTPCGPCSCCKQKDHRKECQGDQQLWNAGFGGCTTYETGGANHKNCKTDSLGGVSANRVCSGCGECTATGVQHNGDNCWHECGHAGLCTWCGGGMCCHGSGNFAQDPDICKGVTHKYGSIHTCVEVPASFKAPASCRHEAFVDSVNPNRMKSGTYCVDLTPATAAADGTLLTQGDLDSCTAWTSGGGGFSTSPLQCSNALKADDASGEKAEESTEEVETRGTRDYSFYPSTYCSALEDGSNINAGEPSKGESPRSCATRCNREKACDAFVIGTAGQAAGKCFLKKNIVLSKCSLMHVLDTYVKDEIAMEAKGILNYGKGCWRKCGHLAGKCSWCGKGACCHYSGNFNGDPLECKHLTHKAGESHACVELPSCEDESSRRRSDLSCHSYLCNDAPSSRRRVWGGEAKDTCRESCGLCPPILGSQGANGCPLGFKKAAESDCLESAGKALLAANRHSQSQLISGSWRDIPPGCSTQVLDTVGWSAYYNANPVGSNNGSFRPVCTKAYSKQDVITTDPDNDGALSRPEDEWVHVEFVFAALDHAQLTSGSKEAIKDLIAGTVRTVLKSHSLSIKHVQAHVAGNAAGTKASINATFDGNGSTFHPPIPIMVDTVKGFEYTLKDVFGLADAKFHTTNPIVTTKWTEASKTNNQQSDALKCTLTSELRGSKTNEPTYCKRTVDLAKRIGAIFVHIPQTVGTTVERILFGEEGNHLYHNDITNLLACRGLLPDKSVISFAVMRDPFGRVASLFDYAQKLAEESNDGSFRWVKDLGGNFTAFVQILDHKRTNLATLSKGFFEDQASFVVDRHFGSGKLLVDYLIRLEDIQKGWSELRRVLPRLPDLTADQARDMDPNRAMTYYSGKSEKLVREAIKRIYERDFKLYGSARRLPRDAIGPATLRRYVLYDINSGDSSNTDGTNGHLGIDNQCRWLKEKSLPYVFYGNAAWLQAQAPSCTPVEISDFPVELLRYKVTSSKTIGSNCTHKFSNPFPQQQQLQVLLSIRLEKLHVLCHAAEKHPDDVTVYLDTSLPYQPQVFADMQSFESSQHRQGTLSLIAYRDHADMSCVSWFGKNSCRTIRPLVVAAWMGIQGRDCGLIKQAYAVALEDVLREQKESGCDCFDEESVLSTMLTNNASLFNIVSQDGKPQGKQCNVAAVAKPKPKPRARRRLEQAAIPISRSCVVTPSYPQEYWLTTRMLSEMRRLADDAVFPRVFVIVGTDTERATWGETIAVNKSLLMEHTVLVFEEIARVRVKYILGEAHKPLEQGSLCSGSPRQALKHLKHLYALQHVGQHFKCDVAWVLDADSLPLRRFKFKNIFMQLGSVLVANITDEQPLLKSKGRDYENINKTILTACATAAERIHSTPLSPEVKVLNFKQNSFWLFETKLVYMMMTGAVRGQNLSTFASTYLREGTISDQIIFNSWMAQMILDGFLKRYTLVTTANLAGCFSQCGLSKSSSVVDAVAADPDAVNYKCLGRVLFTDLHQQALHAVAGPGDQDRWMLPKLWSAIADTVPWCVTSCQALYNSKRGRRLSEGSRASGQGPEDAAVIQV